MLRASISAPVRALLIVLGAVLTLAAPASAAQFTSIAPGLNHTCAVKADHTAWCWGDGRQGQLGVIGAVRERTPVYVIGSFQSSVISASQSYWCQILLDTSLSCSGRSERGQIGNGSVSAAQFPQEVALKGVTKVATGAATTCAVHSGKVACWGEGIRGQLGNGDLVEGPNPSPQDVQRLDNIVDVAVGDTHACAVRGDGRVFCWGDTEDGKLGSGIKSAITTPGYDVTGLAAAKAVVAGDRHSCALKRDATVWCWGDGATGQLGVGAPSQSDSAKQVPGLAGVVQIAAAGLTTCAVKADGGAVCWGDGTGGQIGDGKRTNALSPQPVAGITDAAQIGVGTRHACLVTKTQAPFCWGMNASGQLGTGAPLNYVALTPQLVQDFVPGPAAFLPPSLAGLPAGSTAGGVVLFSGLKISKRSRSSSCPKTASLRLSTRGRARTERIAIQKAKGGCTVTGRFVLPSRTALALKTTYRISGKGLKTASRTLRVREQQ